MSWRHEKWSYMEEAEAEQDEHPLAERFVSVSDKYGNATCETTALEFEADCAALGWDVTLAWQTDGVDEWYVDQDGETILRSLRGDDV